MPEWDRDTMLVVGLFAFCSSPLAFLIFLGLKMGGVI